DPYFPLYSPDAGYGTDPNARRPGGIDIWVGDPWDTVFNEGATGDSVRSFSYGRVLPVAQVKQAFGELAAEVKGRTDLASASRFQRIANLWSWISGTHGSAALTHGTGDGEELVALICEETEAGVDPEWPEGRLEGVALSGATSTDRGAHGGAGTPILLHRGALPGGRLNMVRFYGDYRFDDVLGKPWVADLDDLQV